MPEYILGVSGLGGPKRFDLAQGANRTCWPCEQRHLLSCQNSHSHPRRRSARIDSVVYQSSLNTAFFICAGAPRFATCQSTDPPRPHFLCGLLVLGAGSWRPAAGSCTFSLYFRL